MNRETVVSRALRVTDSSSDDLDTVGVEAQSRVALYPQFQFSAIGDEQLNPVHLIFGTSDNDFRMEDCTENDLTIGAWRSTNNVSAAYIKVSNFKLQPCSGEAVSSEVCCTFSVPGKVENGDILGISHGPSSTLLHEKRAASQLEVLIGRESNNVFFPTATTSQQLGFPLLSFEPSKLLMHYANIAITISL